MRVTIHKKKIISTDETALVLKCYKSALDNYPVTIDPLAPDEKLVKAGLEIEAKTNITGWFPSMLRVLQLSHSATYDLDESVTSIEDNANEYYKFMRSTLIEQLALAMYGSTGHKFTGLINTAMAIERIDNHYILIGELILRLVADALDENSIKKRGIAENGQDDKVVMVLREFLRLLTRPVAVVTQLLAKGEQISSLVAYLKSGLMDDGCADINLFVKNAQEVNAPKKNLNLVSNKLEDAQKTLRGIILVSLDLIQRQLGAQPVIEKNETLNADGILAYYLIIVRALLKDPETFNEVAEVDRKKLVENTVGLYLGDNTDLVSLFIRKSEKIKNKKVLADLLNNIMALKQLLILDEQLSTLKSAVSKFIAVTDFGNWIPIFMNVIRPDVLALAIDKFSEKCRAETKLQIHFLNEKTRWSIGLGTLPDFEWSSLNAINIQIYKLNSMEKLNSIFNKFNALISDLGDTEQQLINHDLISEGEHIVSATVVPRLPPAPAFVANRAWTEVSTPPQAFYTPVPRSSSLNLLPPITSKNQPRLLPLIDPRYSQQLPTRKLEKTESSSRNLLRSQPSASRLLPSSTQVPSLTLFPNRTPSTSQPLPIALPTIEPLPTTQQQLQNTRNQDSQRSLSQMHGFTQTPSTVELASAQQPPPTTSSSVTSRHFTSLQSPSTTEESVRLQPTAPSKPPCCTIG
jgi:hypothetical protein